MDSLEDPIAKKGRIVVLPNTGEVYVIKYMLGDKIIVSNGIYDFPIYPTQNYYILTSPLLEELL